MKFEGLYDMIANGRDVESIKSLLKRGADADVRGGCYKTPLMIVENAEVAKLLLERGADVNARDLDDGKTALMLVKNTEVAKLLLERGADVNARDGN
jgi:ankyrin repeat protein